MRSDDRAHPRSEARQASEAEAAAAERDVGRPETPLRDRPDRYVLAYYEALVALGLSRRRAAVCLQAMYKGPITVAVDDITPDLSRVSFTVKLPTATFDLGDFAKDCDRLRALVKWHATRPDDLAWLITMGEAVRIAASGWRPGANDTVLRLAASVNETAWARRVLLPMLARQRTAAPELADNFSPT